MTTERRIAWKDWREKAAYLDGNARLDASCAFVQTLAPAFMRSPLPWRAYLIHEFVRDGIRYQHDPNRREEFADVTTIFRRGYGDCDDKARAFVAFCVACDIQARIRPVVRCLGDPEAESFEHVMAEARFPGSEAFPTATPEGWIPAELILRGVRLGRGLESARLGPDGKPLLA